MRTHGEAVLFNGDTLSVVIELLARYLTHSYGIVAHVVDRCAINSSALHAMMRFGFLFAPWFDPLY